MVFLIFIGTLILVFGDVYQSGNFAGELGVVRIVFFLVMVVVCALIIWRFKES